MVVFVCFFKQKTAYEMRISDWSSDVCSSDLGHARRGQFHLQDTGREGHRRWRAQHRCGQPIPLPSGDKEVSNLIVYDPATGEVRSEEHTSELQSLMLSSYAVLSSKKKPIQTYTVKRAQVHNKKHPLY